MGVQIPPFAPVFTLVQVQKIICQIESLIKKEIEMSKVEIKETIGCKKKLGVEVESERLDTQISTTLKKMKKEIQVPGFRRGKAPESQPVESQIHSTGITV